MLHFGKAINYWLNETHLANEAARFAAVNKNPGADGTPAETLQEYIRKHADTAELRDGLKVCITFPQGSSVGERVQVKVKSTYSWIPFLGNFLGTANTTIEGYSTMRLEQSPSNYSPTNNHTGC
jgi:hypothetical protein